MSLAGVSLSVSFIHSLKTEDLGTIEVFLPNRNLQIENAPADDGLLHEEDKPHHLETGNDNESDDEDIDESTLPGDHAFSLLDVVQGSNPRVLRNLLRDESRIDSRLEQLRREDEDEESEHDGDRDDANEKTSESDADNDVNSDKPILFYVFASKDVIATDRHLTVMGLHPDTPGYSIPITRREIHRLVESDQHKSQAIWEKTIRPVVHDEASATLDGLGDLAWGLIEAKPQVWIQPAGDIHPDNWIVLLLRLERHFGAQLEYWMRRLMKKNYSEEYLNRYFALYKNKEAYEGLRLIANLSAVRTVIYHLMDEFFDGMNEYMKGSDDLFGCSVHQAHFLHESKIRKAWMPPSPFPEPRDLDELLDDPEYNSLLRPDALTRAFDVLAISSETVVGSLAGLKKSILG